MSAFPDKIGIICFLCVSPAVQAPLVLLQPAAHAWVVGLEKKQSEE